LRPRRLRDATKVDMRVDLFGTTYASPIFLCPTGGEKSFHADGEVAVARAAKARNTLQILSTAASTGIEDVNAALGRPCWYQLYAPRAWEANQMLLRRVEAAGTSVIALTVDNTTGRNSETYLRTRPKDLKQCDACHQGGPGGGPRPMTENLTMPGGRGSNPAMDWAFVDRLRKAWNGKLIIKGIDTHEDAKLCVEHGVDAILVSNHGGRSTETGRATIEALPEVVAEVGGRMPVFVDGGVRRGTDVVKAFALGAGAVLVGRPLLWGLAVSGEDGARRVIELLLEDLDRSLALTGAPSLADLDQSFLVPRP
jgi:4-hydroxymandelate oxidase